MELVQSPSQDGGLVSVVFEFGASLSLCLVDTVTNDKVGGVDINQVLVDEGLAVGSLEQQRKNISRLQSDEVVPLRRPFLQTGVGRVQKTDEEK